MMYKVITLDDYVMFEDKKSAEEYLGFMQATGKFASLNKWTWETKIEK